MGNYRNVKIEFVERTLRLLDQYEEKMHEYADHERYNHTLLINCMLGLIVFPNELMFTYLPTDRITESVRRDMGLFQSAINPNITNLNGLIRALRHAVAHFSIDFESNDDNFSIDKIAFYEDNKRQNLVAHFVPSELLSFIHYYGDVLIYNLREHATET